MSIRTILSLALALAPDPVLPPEAAAHNREAMRHYDAGELAPAVDEFAAAYATLPDARGDLAGREQLLGSLRSTLLALHAETGAPEPLCRLQGLLRGHAEALTAAYPDDPDRLETRSARARLDEVTQQLARLGPDACAPPPPLLGSVVPAPRVEPAAAPAPAAMRVEPAAASTPAVTRAESVVIPVAGGDRRPQRTQVAGAVLVPLGLVALAAVVGLAPRYQSERAAADALHAELAARACTAEEHARMRELLAATRREEGLMIGLGVAGAGLVAAGAVLLVRGGQLRRRAAIGVEPRRQGALLTLSGAF